MSIAALKPVARCCSSSWMGLPYGPWTLLFGRCRGDLPGLGRGEPGQAGQCLGPGVRRAEAEGVVLRAWRGGRVRGLPN